MTGGDRYDEVIEAVRDRVVPDPVERRRLEETVSALVSDTESAIAAADVDADVVHVGSTARGTWVSGDRDIDVFVRFDPELPREDLERHGLQIGNRVLSEGTEAYAEHPYVSGRRNGFDVDLVPCYRVPAATEIRSAVDRTPFHDAYLTERLDDTLTDDVRLFKQFLKGIGAYGSDLKTRGFSGYLSELLVLEHGGFDGILPAATEWHPPVHLDPEDHGTVTHDDPLVVVDPTDPARNVAAVVAENNVARLQHHAREFLVNPSVSRFFPAEQWVLTGEAVAEHVERRGTTPIAIRFPAPGLVDDQLYPQLRRSYEGLRTGFERHGFDVLRGSAFADDTAVLLLELAVDRLPGIERHEGPPVHVASHAQEFFDKYDDSDAYGPYIDGDRYVVERFRSIRTPREFVDARIHDVAHGAQVANALDVEYDVLEGDEIANLVPEFDRELARYFDPIP